MTKPFVEPVIAPSSRSPLHSAPDWMLPGAYRQTRSPEVTCHLDLEMSDAITYREFCEETGAVAHLLTEVVRVNGLEMHKRHYEYDVLASLYKAALPPGDCIPRHEAARYAGHRSERWIDLLEPDYQYGAIKYYSHARIAEIRRKKVAEAKRRVTANHDARDAYSKRFQEERKDDNRPRAKPSPAPDGYFSAADLAKRFGVTTERLWRLHGKGVLPGWSPERGRVGWYYIPEDVIKALGSSEGPGADEMPLSEAKELLGVGDTRIFKLIGMGKIRRTSKHDRLTYVSRGDVTRQKAEAALFKQKHNMAQ